MEFPIEQLEELKVAFPEVSHCDENGSTFFLLPKLQLPDGCVPIQTDALLCPMPRDGYPSRLFFCERIQSRTARNWNGNIHILGRTWHAFSWKLTHENLRLVQLVAEHLRGLR